MGKGQWDPWRSLDEYRRQMERMLEEGREMQRRSGAAGYVWSPLADVLETPQTMFVRVELPGVDAAQIVVEIAEGDLVVRGELPFEPDDPDTTYHLMERAHGAFARRFPLPEGVDSEAVSAVLKEGLLTISIPKRGSRGPARFTLLTD